MKRIIKNQKGFTILELLIATLIFSTILLVATFSVMQISRSYIKGYISTQTQNTARNIADQLTQSIQNSAAESITIKPPSGGYYWFCIGTTRYTYIYNKELLSVAQGGSGGAVLLRDEDPNKGACTSHGDLTGSTGTNRQELLTPRMRLLSPSPTGQLLTSVPLSNNLYRIQLNIIYGEDSSLIFTSGIPTSCQNLSNGGTFCAESVIDTTVQQRTAP